jgi:hypothetical protein
MPNKTQLKLDLSQSKSYEKIVSCETNKLTVYDHDLELIYMKVHCERTEKEGSYGLH